MKEAEIPLDLSFVLDLAQPPSLEEELHLEKEIRMLKASNDIEGVKKYAEDSARQSHQQSIFIAGCITRIAELQTKLIEQQKVINSQQNTNLLKKILKLK